MKILDAKVNWFPDSDTLPVFQLLVEYIPEFSEFLFRKKVVDGRTLYWGQYDEFVALFLMDKNNTPDVGFGGQSFELTIDNERGMIYTETIIGPFMGSPEHSCHCGFPLALPVSVTTDKAGFEQGLTFFSTYMTYPAAHRALNKINESREDRLVIAQDKYGNFGPSEWLCRIIKPRDDDNGN